MPTLHLIHGFVGAGKTTFAKKLAAETGAVRFSHDEWMCVLYGANPDAGEFADFSSRVSGLIWVTASRVLAAGADVILDYGFWTRADRDDYRLRGKEAGAEVKLYVLSADPEIMKSRALKRTEEMPEGQLFIDANAIEIFRAKFEPVDPLQEPCITIKT
jgi:predicted kinase